MRKIDHPSHFINREWSWLEFNNRVLFEAEEDINPILERLKFIAIVSSNLEEFFMVRVAALKQQEKLGLSGSSADGLSPREQLDGIRERVLKLVSRQNMIFHRKIMPELEKNNLILLRGEKQLLPYREKLHLIFERTIKKVLTPISVGPTHPFPTLKTGKLYLAVELEPGNEIPECIEQSRLSFVEIPTVNLGRFLEIDKTGFFVPMEEVVKLFVGDIYHGYQVKSATLFQITRDADFSIDPDAVSDLLKEIETTIKRLHQRSVVRLEYEENIPDAVLKTLIKQHKLADFDLYPMKGLLSFQDLFEFYGKVDRKDLKDKPMEPVAPVCFQEDIFKALNEKDRILFHPYHSYSPVVSLLTRAADDPDVLAVKMTLYRTSSGSEIINALVRAAENGKYVSIVDELRARFDESRNIRVAKRLEEAGAHVVYGIAGLKTHAKCLLIIRREKSGIRRYIHLATGNYNEKTALLYSDFSMFTSDEEIGEDASTLFNLLTGFSLPVHWNKLIAAPLELRLRSLSLIEREKNNAKTGMKAKIVAKMNSLLDKEIVVALYEASNAGVKIDLIVRGICALRPGLKGLSENIRVYSLIGRFLEHPRVYYFLNGGDEEYYLSSADWMTRNLDRRVELLFPVSEKSATSFIQHIIDVQMKDSANRWVLKSTGKYERYETDKPLDSFGELYKFIKQREKQREKNTLKKFRPLRHPSESDDKIL